MQQTTVEYDVIQYQPGNSTDWYMWMDARTSPVDFEEHLKRLRDAYESDRFRLVRYTETVTTSAEVIDG